MNTIYDVIYLYSDDEVSEIAGLYKTDISQEVL